MGVFKCCLEEILIKVKMSCSFRVMGRDGGPGTKQPYLRALSDCDPCCWWAVAAGSSQCVTVSVAESRHCCLSAWKATEVFTSRALLWRTQAIGYPLPAPKQQGIACFPQQHSKRPADHPGEGILSSCSLSCLFYFGPEHLIC